MSRLRPSAPAALAAALVLLLLGGGATAARTPAQTARPPAVDAAHADRAAPPGSALPVVPTPEGATPLPDSLLGTGELDLARAAFLTGGPSGTAAARTRLGAAGYVAGTSRAFRLDRATVLVAVHQVRDAAAARGLLGATDLGTTVSTFDPGLPDSRGRTVDQPDLHAVSVSAARGRFLVVVAVFGPDLADTDDVVALARTQLAALRS